MDRYVMEITCCRTDVALSTHMGAVLASNALTVSFFEAQQWMDAEAETQGADFLLDLKAPNEDILHTIRITSKHYPIVTGRNPPCVQKCIALTNADLRSAGLPDNVLDQLGWAPDYEAIERELGGNA
ncbi:hypothetical protein [Desulfatibacillum aliphaticivorans]|uniref:hypothetical protein n=1 Tax=Desulfatibacillum aliphaticivorans TaxID=218208 RepID=UPI000425540A|nr:hypothetical protein [Desulfatibacillum aliphaticivorans]